MRTDLLTLHDPSTCPQADELDLQEVSSLLLSFQNIYKIDNMEGFENLTKLQLDNNRIQKIQNLDHLVNLEWLDLSFNQITTIENLDTLVNLKDLSLFNNQITKIENLDALKKLNVLSLGNNQIENLDYIKDLRQFKNLRLLNLKGNKVCDDADYHNTVFAYLTGLKYLDYTLIEPYQFQKARDAKLETVRTSMCVYVLRVCIACIYYVRVCVRADLFKVMFLLDSRMRYHTISPLFYVHLSVVQTSMWWKGCFSSSV